MSDEITLKGFWPDNSWPFENSYLEAWTNVIYNVIAKKIETQKKKKSKSFYDFKKTLNTT